MNKPIVRPRKWNRTVFSLLTLSAASASAQSVLYWDSNDLNPGAGATPTGTWGVDSFWSTDPAGGVSTAGWTSTSDIAIFSAGADATGPYNLTVSGTQTAASVLVEEGNITIPSGTINTGTSTFTIGTGVGSTARVNFPASGIFNNAGKVVLDGGTLFNTNASNAISFISATKGLEITANGGTVGYNDGSGTNAFTTIYTGTITGTLGTTTAGVGTLTKIGPDEFRVQGANVGNFTFQKLLVLEGLYRIGSSSTPTEAASPGFSEGGFGADPASVLPDAITLNGGAIGLSLSLTLNANRGITIGPNGGTFNGGGGGAMTVPGPLSGSGKLIMAGASGSVILQNATNTTTFTGAVQGDGSTLTLSQSLNATNLSGAGGTISVSTSRIFTVGSDNTSTTYAGVIAGAGQFTKTGTGTLGLRTEWTNTGATNISNGALIYEISAAGLGNSSQVNISATGTLDMNNINDTVGSLVGAGNIINGGNLTLTGNNGSTAAFSGNFSGTAASRTFTKNGTGIQTLSGNNDFTSVNFNDGRINFNSNTAVGSAPINVGANADEFVSTAPNISLSNSIILAATAAPKFYATANNGLSLAGIVSGTGGILRDDTGAGTLTLSGANTFSGGFRITSRTVSVGDKAGFGTGTLTFGDAVTAPANAIVVTATTDLSGPNAITNAIVLNQSFSIAGDNLELTAAIDLGATTKTITASNAAGKATILSGNVIGVGAGLTKAGTGVLTLASATNTYTGATTITAGTLLVNGTLAGTQKLDISGILGGTGSISPALDGSVNLLANGRIAPGTNAGTLTVSLSGTGIFDLRSGIDIPTGALQFELGTALASDKIVLSGGPLEIGSQFLNFDDFAFTALAGFGEGDYLLFDTSSAISGLLGTSLTGNVNGFDAEIQLADGGKDLVLHVVPEPGSFAIMLGGFAVLMGRRKRR